MLYLLIGKYNIIPVSELELDSDLVNYIKYSIDNKEKNITTPEVKKEINKNDKKRKAIKIIRLSSLILCILICISTLTLKQHSFLDLVGGCVLFAFYYTIVYIRPFRQTKLSTDC